MSKTAKLIAWMWLGLLASLLVAPPVGAQSPGVEVQRDLASALRVARPLVRDDPERAVKLLVALNDEYPANPQVLVLLGEAYRMTGDNAAARAAYEECLSVQPTHLQAGTLLGLLYVEDGDVAQGEAVFDELLARTEYGVNTYRTIANLLTRQGYVEEALRYYEEGRIKTKGNYILALDIAYVQQSMGNYKEALQEYLYVAETNPRQQRLIKTRVIDLLRDPDADQPQLIEVLESQDKDGASGQVIMEILATVYLDRGMLESALEMAIRADEGANSTGDVLFQLAELSLQQYERQPSSERQAYFDLSLRALEAYLAGHPDSPQVPRAKLMLIELLVDLASGRVKATPGTDLEVAVVRALNALDWLIDSFPGTDYAEQAYLRKGDVVFRVQKQPKKALAIYQKGMQISRFYRNDFAERLGRVYLITGEYGAAQQHFAWLINSNNADLHDTGVYYSGLMLAFTKQYETARDTLTSLAEENPSSAFTNDAIELAWIVEEGLKGEQKFLNAFVSAMQFELADDTTHAVKELQKIVAQPEETPLRGRALIRLGELYTGWGRDDQALEMYDTFVMSYPKDTRVADVKRKIGQVQEQEQGNNELALKTYESILLDYPNYIFLDEVRADVMRIRAMQGGNP